uniref:Uncharacterized protein n=1 Tax=Rousettus aegyptiacus TaxID=9407 RepID=A0A7J8BEM6_ROUAE|nr:hypothetical protein HJG63_009795 [Rousettus aegyptiacus]
MLSDPGSEEPLQTKKNLHHAVGRGPSEKPSWSGRRLTPPPRSLGAGRKQGGPSPQPGSPPTTPGATWDQTASPLLQAHCRPARPLLPSSPPHLIKTLDP